MVKVVSLNVQTKVVVILFMKTGPYSVASLTRCMQEYKEKSLPLVVPQIQNDECGFTLVEEQ